MKLIISFDFKNLDPSKNFVRFFILVSISDRSVSIFDIFPEGISMADLCNNLIISIKDLSVSFFFLGTGFDLYL